MQDGSSLPGEAAAAWLKEHFASDDEPSISISWTPSAPDDAVFHEVLAILFGPETGDLAA